MLENHRRDDDNIIRVQKRNELLPVKRGSEKAGR